ncbi:MAG: DNA-processing protein DprA [Lachnospiraceae bacterium]|nr:DNA-processing protein DprA [Lachnospiraceae bacterium]
MINEEEKICRFRLHNWPGVGDRTIEKLLDYFGSAWEACHGTEEDLKQVLREKTAVQAAAFNRTFDGKKAYNRMREKGIVFYTRDDREYPSRLRKLNPPPFAIYCLGRLPADEGPAAAIIGARECSEYGIHMARAFAEGFAKAGIAVVSGMARGIDGISQKAALACGGETYAVLGSGADVCYPASNRELYCRIVEGGGGILSIFPPGTMPLKQQFPERNRIVAGLSDLVLVVEARQKSGTWITVDMALEQGKNVYAVPGRLTDRLSDGCNLLIRQGAGIALSPEDIIAETVLLGNRKQWGQTAPAKKKGGEETESKGVLDGKTADGENCEEILQFLDYYPKSVDAIAKDMELNGVKTEISEIFSRLTELCISEKAKQISGKYFVKIDK